MPILLCLGFLAAGILVPLDLPIYRQHVIFQVNVFPGQCKCLSNPQSAVIA